MQLSQVHAFEGETDAEGAAHPRSSSFLPFVGFPMVKLANPGDLRPDPQHCKAAGPLPVKVEIEDPLEDEHGPLDKRSRISPPFQQQWGSGTRMGRQVVPQDLLEEPSPLGLRLRKSPSLVDLIQMRLSQADSAATSCITSCENSEAGKDKSTALSGAADKMKASNFPITLLRIGTWERVSKYEGDLVAKCYFAKHKLVWEVLEGGLKSKIEIQWSDITSLKATCPENGPGTLDIVLGRQPLFFRETNPQPRKHTLWQATSDFTGGQASIHRRHFLQCAQGLLSKHFEKLIQCDPHLNMLSQQAEIILESPYFEPRCSVFEDQEESKFHGFDKLKDTCGSPISGFGDHGSPCAAPSISTKSEPKDPVGRTPDSVLREIPSISVIDTRVIGENAGHETEAPKGLTCGNQFKVPGLRASMSMCDLVNHIEHCISGQPTSDNPFLLADGLPNRDMLEELNRYLLSDTQIASTSDEQSLMSRVNSLCCLLQKDAATAPNLHTDCGDSAAVHRGADNKPRPLLLGPPLERKPLFDLSAVEEESDDDTAYKQPPPGMSRKESFGELLMYLPRIASLPQVLFNK